MWHQCTMFLFFIFEIFVCIVIIMPFNYYKTSQLLTDHFYYIGWLQMCSCITSNLVSNNCYGFFYTTYWHFVLIIVWIITIHLNKLISSTHLYSDVKTNKDIRETSFRDLIRVRKYVNKMSEKYWHTTATIFCETFPAFNISIESKKISILSCIWSPYL